MAAATAIAVTNVANIDLIDVSSEHPAASVQSTLQRQFKSTLRRQLNACCSD